MDYIQRIFKYYLYTSFNYSFYYYRILLWKIKIETMPFTLEQALDDAWLPDAHKDNAEYTVVMKEDADKLIEKVIAEHANTLELLK
jgi:hypothetical protein